MKSTVLTAGLAVLAAAFLLAGCDKSAAPAPAAKSEASSSTASASVAAPAPKPAANPEAPALPPAPASAKVSILTTKGEIVVVLDGKRAPITTANFLLYVDAKKFDGATFYRAMSSGTDAGFIQASGVGFTFPPIPHESTKKTGLSHTNGTISMARYALGTATNEFTISVGDMTYMDAGRDPKGDNQGFAAFGHVVKGMGVVRAILHGRISNAKAKPGEWAGQMLKDPVKIISAKRID